MTQKSQPTAIGLVDKGSIDEFVNGIFGVNKQRNKKAFRSAAKIVAATAAYSIIKSGRRG